jgi:hypothetical protein
MKIKPIFVDDGTREGLYAMQYIQGELDEFERLFDWWNDVQAIHEYCLGNLEYLENDFFLDVSLDMIETKISDEAARLEELLHEYCQDGFSGRGDNLQMLFKPLKDHEHALPVRQETKVKILDTYNFPKPILRLYGIRLGTNTFLITGGAVKWTQKMNQHPDTQLELEKLEIVRRFLIQNDIECSDDLNYYYEQI